jgi:hypothetical protein
MDRRYAVFTVVVLAFVLTVVPHPVDAQTSVTSCGQSFRGAGVLAGDLDCSGFTGHAVTIERGKLDLQGFTISGSTGYGVSCPSNCKIVGPGTITGSRLQGVRAARGVKLFNVTITNSGNSGVDASNNKGTSKALLKGCTITGNANFGVEADKSVGATASTISGNGTGGVAAGPNRGCNAGHVALKDSTVTGNGTDGSCGVAFSCADVQVCRKKPKLIGTSTCDHSCKTSAVPCDVWGVCALD